MIRIIKIALATLLFLFLLDMPYGFYQLVRFVALVGFGILAYSAREKESKTEMIIRRTCTTLSTVFQNSTR